MSKHTPGPWKIGYGLVYSTECSDEGDTVCQSPDRKVMPESAKKWKENAQLIAAAPELLEALDIIVKLDENKVYMDEPWQEALKLARAAIAKALGEE